MVKLECSIKKCVIAILEPEPGKQILFKGFKNHKEDASTIKIKLVDKDNKHIDLLTSFGIEKIGIPIFDNRKILRHGFYFDVSDVINFSDSNETKSLRLKTPDELFRFEDDILVDDNESLEFFIGEYPFGNLPFFPIIDKNKTEITLDVEIIDKE